jgi:hypothetical protein
VRPQEDEAVRKLLHHGSVALERVPEYADPHTKANALLQVRAGCRVPGAAADAADADAAAGTGAC